ncbi:alpha-L-rhamnosidase N-terminal domain-containing protein [Niabella ginsengisoli]|uniref:Alpha-L-rhamnosidase N-terminal domain-containing protein n=1 Tax=Niabella ginsengisoli TaxID=522298 RepID=A0ABS9SQB8_9BACT|nr:alpha-L-rhamnosidase N-terminal domain-containing protein [Niabella ginsengisoli]MCH5600571.1 alpha-L-rhamnosidase N-terminal domain-containing protein [Niabella ginsengisoli]
MWDSKQQQSDQQLIYFNGNTLSSHKRYWWCVELQTNNGTYTSQPTWFETAKMQPADWVGQWITDEYDIEFAPSPMFRKLFKAKSNIQSARCYISGLGYYELHVNGKSVNPLTLDPGFTDYSKRILYKTYDVTDKIKKGSNCIGIQLGNGWFNEQTPTVWNFHQAPWRKRPQTICELHITYTNGTSEIIKTDESWSTAIGPLQFDNIHAGTTYDARLEQQGWATHSFDDSKWKKAKTTKSTADLLETQAMPSVKVTDTIDAIEVKK